MSSLLLSPCLQIGVNFRDYWRPNCMSPSILGQVAPEERTHRVSVDPFLTRFRHLTIASPKGRGTLRLYGHWDLVYHPNKRYEGFYANWHLPWIIMRRIARSREGVGRESGGSRAALWRESGGSREDHGPGRRKDQRAHDATMRHLNISN